ncbi:MAG: hypothetical protein SPJ62_13480 [Inconstantimicrobium porci]|uniref:hypothetical protein n=1 Tax=Inconstantimicrobium porci TaxID=2652291 RepID=UPI002A91C73C|nr:hypothetical protein [Inconstantimicrobium porci]MDY5912981.1 hypothetical protein [Inconstantimicrobium porci]
MLRYRLQKELKINVLPQKAQEARIASESASRSASSSSGETSSSSRSVPKSSTVNTDNIGAKVYITATGKKYHSHANCGNSKTAYQVSLTEAESRGLSACKKCY